jgi:hypothetical protein
VLNLSDAPANTWLLSLDYGCLFLNHLASAAIDLKSPLQDLTGQQPDISKFLHIFYETVYYHIYSNSIPSTSKEDQGRLVGAAVHVVDALTHKILNKSNKGIYRSAIHSFHNGAS